MSSRKFKIMALLALPLAGAPFAIMADDDFDEFRKQINESYEQFANEAREEYANFREQVNKEYEDFMRAHPWTPTEIEEPLPPPQESEPEPQIEPEDQQDKPVENPKPIIIEEVIDSEPPQPQPQPIEEIEEMPLTITIVAPLPIDAELQPGPKPEPVPEPEPVVTPEPEQEPVVIPEPKPEPKPIPPMTVDFYGTEMQLRPADFSKFKINGADENAFADAWAALAGNHTNNLIIDCLKVRDAYQLPDWGYLKFLDTLAGKLTSPGSNEQAMLLGYLLNQSGYKVRYAYDEKKKLHLLFSSKGIIYNNSRYFVDGDWFYSYTKPEGNQVFICKFAMPKEQQISMGIDREPLLAYKPGTTREIVPKKNSQYKFTVTPNKNLVDFYGDYPESTLDNNPLSMWLIHGNTPVSSQVREQLYPALREAVAGKSQLEAVQLLLKVAQTFPYEYDDEIWGRDRAFWMEESWEYPYSDCEDHSVNFAHMVRDILGLDVCLIYYPGHLSSCVAITEGDVQGDYIDYKGKRYYVCDPTYFYAGVGKTAPGNNNAEAVLLPLR